MKALSFKIPKTNNQSIRVQVDKQKYYYDNFHYHPEIQISYILEGSGTRIIGNSIGKFNKDEIYIIGSNIPHIFKSDKIYYEKKSSLISHSISIYFSEISFGEKFFHLPETQSAYELLLNSRKIIFIKPKINDQIKKEFLNISDVEGFEKFLLFLKILDQLAKTKNSKLLSKTTYELRNTEKNGKRINDVFDFVINNYNRNLTLEEISKIANLSVTAFCRFFKERTRKSFIEFVNEVRIGEACKLLNNQDFSISQICYEVGFNNISNFNRKFKEITNLTPKNYRRTFSENKIE
ncbi:MAG: helix-turn-helix domain-containing protein [Ignavibacteriae bacterium]|nr:helix-turn-helix domain-containing protein [Ignavibacteriota bacterium]